MKRLSETINGDDGLLFKYRNSSLNKFSVTMNFILI